MTARYWQGANPLMSQTQAREVAALERVKATWQMTGVELAKVFAANRGYTTREGGWVYNAAGRPVAHGWAAFAERLAVHGQIRVGKGVNWQREGVF